jgi:hypothetical protein
MRKPLSSEQAREYGARGGRASAKARQKLTLERVEAELCPLATLDDAMRRLDRIGLWAAAGMLHGALASAVVRSVEVWVRAHESKLTREVTEELRARLEELERQAKGRVLGVVR